jgi:hypothetical protein
MKSTKKCHELRLYDEHVIVYLFENFVPFVVEIKSTNYVQSAKLQQLGRARIYRNNEKKQ